MGSHTVLKGPSGSGKTTLLNLIAGIACLTSGRLPGHGTDLVPLPEPQRDRFRAAFGYVFQTFNWLRSRPWRTSLLAMRFANAIPRRAQRQRAADRLNLASNALPQTGAALTGRAAAMVHALGQ
jgi:ABC-type lipoprotein export system ATPase subunit